MSPEEVVVVVVVVVVAKNECHRIQQQQSVSQLIAKNIIKLTLSRRPLNN